MEVSSRANLLALILLLTLTLPACARPTPGGPAGSPASGQAGGRVSAKGQTFTDSTLLAVALKLGNGTAPLVMELEQCTFTSKTSFTGAGTEYSVFGINCVLKDCTFEQDLVADQTQFSGRVNMVKCRFKKRVSFQNCIFMAPVGFRTGAFDGDAAWNNTLFMREASFMDSHFFDVARLQACRFMAPVQFGNAVFHKNADLTLTRFDEGAWFDYATFMGKADLGGVRALGPVSFRAGSAGQILLTNVTAYDKFGILNMQLKDSTQVKGAVFMKGRP